MECGPALADNLTLIGEDNRFCRGCPHVKTYEKCHVQNLRGYHGAIVESRASTRGQRLPSMATFSYGYNWTPAQQYS